MPTEILSRHTWAAVTPSWSADGERLVFAAVAKNLDRQGNDQEADDIWIVRRDGTELQQVTEDPSSDWSPIWTRLQGEERIFFVSDRSGTPNLWSIQVR